MSIEKGEHFLNHAGGYFQQFDMMGSLAFDVQYDEVA